MFDILSHIEIPFYSTQNGSPQGKKKQKNKTVLVRMPVK
jgi:hypothetical protein